MGWVTERLRGSANEKRTRSVRGCAHVELKTLFEGRFEKGGGGEV